MMDLIKEEMEVMDLLDSDKVDRERFFGYFANEIDRT